MQPHAPVDPSSDVPPSDPGFPAEPVLPLLARSGLGEHPLGQATQRAKVLEVHQVWEDVLVDTRHFRLTRDDAVSVGADLGHRWRFLGIDMGWVPRPMASVLPYAPPMWSEVTTEWRGDFHAPDHALPLRRDHELFVRHGDRYEARILSGWGGFAERDGEQVELSTLVAEGLAHTEGDELVVPMVDGLRLYVEIDGVGFYAHLVFEGTPLLQRNAGQVDYPLLSVGSLVGFVGMLFGLVVMFSPAPPQNELVEVPERILQLVVEAPTPDDPAPKTDKVDPGEGERAKDDEGKRGLETASRDKAKGSPREVAQKTLDRQVAENAGVLGALAELGADDGMFASSQMSAALLDGVGGLHGKTGTQLGSHGLGGRGDQLGGGGTVEGLGGGLGTNGLGSGRTGYGSDGGIGGGKGDGRIREVGQGPIVLGALDRGVIDEVIKRHLTQIRYCYQRELQRDTSLAGKVVMKFTIAKDGSVSSANAQKSTLGNASVDQCLVGRFLRMQFPEPEGGGIVIVSYPFVFGS